MMLCEQSLCTGCGACFNACPFNYITMERDEHGFDRPVIDKSRCISCGRCSMACPQLVNDRPFRPLGDQRVLMAALNADEGPIKHSSSGGVAYALSREIIGRGGVVYGAAYDDKMRVVHTRIDAISELSRLQGSKYVQSYIGQSYRYVRQDLRRGLDVLFIGVGCQVDGLYRYLGDKKPDNLYTVDLLCGGGASPGVFELYIHAINEKYLINITDYNFRDKRYGYGYLMSSVSESGETRILRGSDAGFVRSMGKGYVRECCFKCPYARIDRVSDLTLGDFWNVDVDESRFRLGTNLVLANTQRGFDLLSDLGDKIWLDVRSQEEALASQSAALRQGRPKPADYEEFFGDVRMLEWHVVYSRYLKSPVIHQEIFDSIPAWLAAYIGKAKRKVRLLGK